MSKMSEVDTDLQECIEVLEHIKQRCACAVCQQDAIAGLLHDYTHTPWTHEPEIHAAVLEQELLTYALDHGLREQLTFH